ncbi:conserved hypothetical protein [Burkholderia sp. 8Y]|uniref:hypothetical protein n=1 Tax=Burkholderia sp. 8Y TaxID=2653133 RepID=UPI0012F1678F|nr:hypothetical protein [Burkholderia sp. 8Y]VXB26088.1 conserved hypothetical protein [Burkholderia sp. 8Y]
MIKRLLQLVTGDDNVTLEPAYAWSAVAVIVGLGLGVYSVATGKPFDMQSYGTGAAALLAGLGISAKLGK